MFRNILNWMLSNSPGFMRPALGWLIDGIRSITNYVSQRWTSLGSIAAYWRAKVIYWGYRAADFVLTFGVFVTWLVVVYVPNYVGTKVAQAYSALTALASRVLNLALAGIARLEQWAIARVAELLNLLSALKTWAKYELNLLVGKVSNLIHALMHVLSGPDVLAEWLVGAMWRAMARLVYAQRDRIVMWLTRESVAFTRWLALELEDIIMRWL